MSRRRKPISSRFSIAYGLKLLLIMFPEINECEEPNGCPMNANCTDLLGRCEYTCKDGFEGGACSGKYILI